MTREARSRAPSTSTTTARRVWGSASDRAASTLLYAATLTLLAKLARVAELSLRIDSAWPFGAWPLTLGQDLMLVAAVALAADGLCRLRSRALSLGGRVLLVLPLALLLPADVVAHRLTGGPITWQRLRGDEGATLADLGLLSTEDLVYGLLAVALCSIAIYPVLRLQPRTRWLRAWARPRSLLVTLLLGFGATLVQPLILERSQGLAEQPLFVLASSLIEPPRLKPISLGDSQWEALQRPRSELPPPPAAPPLAGHARNVIIFLAEGIAFEHTGFDPGTVAELQAAVKKARKGPKGSAKRRATRLRPSGDPTENLSRRQRKHGLLFERYYANWHASIQAIFSIVCSAFPPMRGDIVRVKPRIDCGELSEVMASHGIASGLFHGGRFSFYNKLALLGQRGYRIEVDAEDLATRPGYRENQWGIDDRAVVDATLEWIDGLPQGQRFAALLIPITAHYPYWVPRDFGRPFPPTSRRLRFLNAVAFQDEVVERLMRGLEKRGLYDDTLFVWLGDHGHYVGEPARATAGLRGFYEPNLHVPLVFISPRMFPTLRPPEARATQRLGGHRDLLPTILDALGLPAERRHQGQSLLSPSYEHRRQFFGADNGRYVGFIEGHRKFVLEPQSGRVEYYDLQKDPDELHEISRQHPEQMRRFSDDALLFARAVEGRIAAAPTLEEAVSVEHIYDLFMAHAQVVVHPPRKPARVAIEPDAARPTPAAPATPLEAIACERAPGEIRCPGLSPIRVELGKVQGEKRRCVMVPVPAEGSIELAVDDPATATLMTGTIVALPKTKDRDARFRVTSYVDGRPHGSVSVDRNMAARPRHPRPQESVVYRLARRSLHRKPPAADAGVPQAKAPPAETTLCLQLTTLVP